MDSKPSARVIFVIGNSPAQNDAITWLTTVTSPGATGSGKSTLCKRLVQAHPCKLVHLSLGDVLRGTVVTAGPGSDDEEQLAGYVARGELVPSRLLFPVLKRHIPRVSAAAGGDGPVVLLDGFPRCLEQAREFEAVVSLFLFVQGAPGGD